MKKVLLTGASGLVGSRLQQILDSKFEILTPDEKALDLLDSDSVKTFLDDMRPDTVIHCAAYTDVTGGESQRDDITGLAYQLNVDATEHLAKLCDQKNIFLIHISTDYVFPGTDDFRGPYLEITEPYDDPNTLTWYGWTKRVAEKKVRAFPNIAIVRISFPIGPVVHQKLDYAHKILHLYDTQKLYPLVTDQYMTSTYIDDLALALEKIIDQHATGIWHVSSRDSFTSFQFASYLIEKARDATDVVQPMTLEEFKKKTGNSRYPQYGGLNVRATEEKLGLKFRTWRKIAKDIRSIPTAD